MGEENQQIKSHKNRRPNRAGRFFSFLIGNWVVIVIIALFVSQIYLIYRTEKIAKNLNVSASAQISEVDINQLKSMVSSMFSRIGTMQGDLNYIKSRR